MTFLVWVLCSISRFGGLKSHNSQSKSVAKLKSKRAIPFRIHPFLSSKNYQVLSSYVFHNNTFTSSSLLQFKRNGQGEIHFYISSTMSSCFPFWHSTQYPQCFFRTSTSNISQHVCTLYIAIFIYHKS